MQKRVDGENKNMLRWTNKVVVKYRGEKEEILRRIHFWWNLKSCGDNKHKVCRLL